MTASDSPLSLLVYCGSKHGRSPSHNAAAAELAQTMLDRKIRLVFGGGGVGLMGKLATAILDGGGHVTGIIPTFLHTEEVALPNCTELIEVPSMHDRKLRMLEHAGAILALPGGFGTMDELFEAITWRQLGLHDKPIGILNVDGYYDALLRQLDVMFDEGYLTRETRSIIRDDVAVQPLLDWLEREASDAAPDPLLPRWT